MAKVKTEKEGTFSHTSLHRSSTNKVIAGVAGGLGEYFEVDATLIRIIFVLLAFFNGIGFLIYLILWIVMPSSENPASDPKSHMRENMAELRESANKFAHDLKFHSDRENSKLFIGGLLIVLGILFLLNSFGFYAQYNIDRLWPLILVGIGLLLLSRNG